MCGALMVTAYPIPCGASMYGLFLQNKPRSIAFIAAAIREFFKMPLAVYNKYIHTVYALLPLQRCTHTVQTCICLPVFRIRATRTTRHSVLCLLKLYNRDVPSCD